MRRNSTTPHATPRPWPGNWRQHGTRATNPCCSPTVPTATASSISASNANSANSSATRIRWPGSSRTKATAQSASALSTSPAWCSCRSDMETDAYAYCTVLTRDQWAWEFLRRNPDYRADYRRFITLWHALEADYGAPPNRDFSRWKQDPRAYGPLPGDADLAAPTANCAWWKTKGSSKTAGWARNG